MPKEKKTTCFLGGCGREEEEEVEATQCRRARLFLPLKGNLSC